MKKSFFPLLAAFVILTFVACKETEQGNQNEENPQMEEMMAGATLYTVRNEMESAPKATIDSVAAIGYKYIEATTYADGKFYGMDPAAFKAYLESKGLVPLSAHMGSVTLTNADTLIADTKAAGFKYFVIPVPPMGHFKFDPETRSLGMSDSLDVVLNIIKEVGQKCKNAGLELLYHNHDFEFKEDANGVKPIEYFLENTDPSVVNFQMDLYWVTKAGADPVAYFEQYPGRFKIWHVKDMDAEGRFAPVGQGTIDFARILAEKEKSGMEYYIVEQDMTFDGMAPLDAIEISYEGLKKIGFQ